MKTLIVVTLLAGAAVTGARAQTVYRCGSSYSQSPCAQAKLVDVGDARSAAQQAEAQGVVERERRLAAEMRHDRLADERALRGGATAASLGGHAPTKVAVLVPERHHKKKSPFAKALPTTDFIAFDPASRKRRGD